MSADLYVEHFGFTERPFSLSPDPAYLYWSDQHARALSVLQYGIVTRASLTLVSGDVGTGKTTLILELVRTVANDVTVGLISNARDGRGELLRWVLNAFDIDAPPELDYVSMFQRFQDFVLREYAQRRSVVLIVDEAQNLKAETLEELRMFTNINSGKDELLQIILVGQPEVRDLIRQPGLQQFAQRVAAACHLNPMTVNTTLNYIVHRLKHAGGTGEEITPEAMRLVHEESGGVPRIINKLCDLALVYASSADQKTVDAGTIQELIADGLILKSRPEPLVLHDRIHSVGRAAE